MVIQALHLNNTCRPMWGYIHFNVINRRILHKLILSLFTCIADILVRKKIIQIRHSEMFIMLSNFFCQVGCFRFTNGSLWQEYKTKNKRFLRSFSTTARRLARRNCTKNVSSGVDCWHCHAAGTAAVPSRK